MSDFQIIELSGTCDASGDLTLTADKNAWGYIEKIVITLDTGGSSGDTVVIQDNHNHGIKITLSAYSEDDVLTVYLVSAVEIGTSEIVSVEYWYCDLEGSRVPRRTNTGDKGMDLRLDKDENVNTLSFTFTGTGGVKTYQVYFRDGYLY